MFEQGVVDAVVVVVAVVRCAHFPLLRLLAVYPHLYSTASKLLYTQVLLALRATELCELRGLTYKRQAAASDDTKICRSEEKCTIPVRGKPACQAGNASVSVPENPPARGGYRVGRGTYPSVQLAPCATHTLPYAALVQPCSRVAVQLCSRLDTIARTHPSMYLCTHTRARAHSLHRLTPHTLYHLLQGRHARSNRPAGLGALAGAVLRRAEVSDGECVVRVGGSCVCTACYVLLKECTSDQFAVRMVCIAQAN